MLKPNDCFQMQLSYIPVIVKGLTINAIKHDFTITVLKKQHVN